jgi:ribonuclease HI
VVIEDEDGLRLKGCYRFLGIKTNNEAEYLALIEGLNEVSKWKPDRIVICLDSKLVVEQIKGAYKVRAPNVAPLYKQAMEMLATLPFEIKHVDREQNNGADDLANRAIKERGKG